MLQDPLVTLSIVFKRLRRPIDIFPILPLIFLCHYERELEIIRLLHTIVYQATVSTLN